MKKLTEKNVCILIPTYNRPDDIEKIISAKSVNT